MPGEQQRINVPALVLLAAMTGGTASIAGIKFSWVSTDVSPASTEISELRTAISQEVTSRQEADAAISKGTEEIYRELIIIREKCKYIDRRCSRLERGYKNDQTEY